jgi:hypothetical protein
MNSVKQALENAVKRRFNLRASARLPALAVAVVTLAATSSAHAAITMPDLTEIIAAIMAVITIVSSIGIAVLSVVVTVQLFRWIKASMR